MGMCELVEAGQDKQTKGKLKWQGSLTALSLSSFITIFTRRWPRVDVFMVQGVCSGREEKSHLDSIANEKRPSKATGR